MADRGRGRRTRGRPGPGRAGPSRSFAGGAPGRRLGGSANTNMEVAIYQTPASPVRPYLPGFHPNQAGIRREANQTARGKVLFLKVYTSRSLNKQMPKFESVSLSSLDIQKY